MPVAVQEDHIILTEWFSFPPIPSPLMGEGQDDGVKNPSPVPRPIYIINSIITHGKS